MTTQTYVTYISAMLAHLQTIVRETAAKTKELLGDSDTGRKLLLITLMVFVTIYVAGRITAQYYNPVYTKVLMQKVLALEEQQNRFANDLSKLTTRADTFDGRSGDRYSISSCRLMSLENRLDLLEGNHFVGVREVGTPFTFQNPFSNVDKKKTRHDRSCRKRVRKSSNPHFSEKAKIREYCRSLYGDKWWDHPNKNKRMVAARRKLEMANSPGFTHSPALSPALSHVADDSSSDEKIA